MAKDDKARIAAFLANEYSAARLAENAGSAGQAWLHLERAHIVAQSRIWPHCRSHLTMLAMSIRQRDRRETAGQILRLALAPLGNITGRLPIGNTGRSNVSAFAQMDIPPDIQVILNPAPN